MSLSLGDALKLDGNDLPDKLRGFPVRVGDVVDVKCSESGRRPNTAVARFQGFVLVVLGARKGDKLKVKVTHVYPKFATATRVVQ